jgi:hypothetical protein
MARVMTTTTTRGADELMPCGQLPAFVHHGFVGTW